MQTLLHLSLFAASLVALAALTDVMVGAVVAIADRYRIPGSIAGATLAATATSAPELGTNVFALLAASEDAAAANIGIGTIVGSAIFNLAIVVGLVGIAGGCTISKRVVWRDGTVYAAAASILLVMVAVTGTVPLTIGRIEGVALVFAYGGYLFWLIRDARRNNPSTSIDGKDQSTSVGPNIAKLVITILLVAAACHFLVESTRFLARVTVGVLGLDPSAVTAVLSLVVVAAATSAPDALTSLAAARRGEGSMAVSNAIGSNTFDILICLGLPVAVVGGRTVSPMILYSAVFLLLTTVLLIALAVRGWSITRPKGVVLIISYGLFLGLVGGLLASR
jgi:cation:H+ antiporter